MKLLRVDELVEFYKEAMQDIVDSMERNIWAVSSNPRNLVLMSETMRILRDLDAKAFKWANEFIEQEYEKNIVFVNNYLRVAGMPAAQIQSFASWAAVHRGVIELLIGDPVAGITPRLKRVSQQLGQSVESYISQNKLLSQQNSLLRKRIATSVMMNESINEARDEIMSSLMNSGPPSSLMGLSLGSGSASQTMASAPYIVIPTIKGSRRLHLFDYVTMTATTTRNAVRTQARNNRVQEAGIFLVRITPNPPLTPCVCSMYAGRVFALTEEIARTSGYPLLARTPNSGPPFHPYCTHSTIPYIPDRMSPRSTENVFKNGTGMKKVASNGLPQALLGVNFTQAQKWFRSNGGIMQAVLQNPQIRSFRVSDKADQEVLSALGNSSATPFRIDSSSQASSTDLE